ncbi:unnamed protein product [marine sediment metagenome]|uniref:Uncharacterized protein n=1 Tax=marine sediment metagenome TaxID=412755 RepID=X1CYB2_9ZZZZ
MTSEVIDANNKSCRKSRYLREILNADATVDQKKIANPAYQYAFV